MPETPHHSLRILHLASWYPSEVHGTLGNFVKRHISAISSVHSGEVWYAAPSPLDQSRPSKHPHGLRKFSGAHRLFQSPKACGSRDDPRPLESGRRKTTVSRLTWSICTWPIPLEKLHEPWPAAGAFHSLSRSTGQRTMKNSGTHCRFGAGGP